MTQNKLPHIVDRILLSTKFEAEQKIKSPSKSKRIDEREENSEWILVLTDNTYVNVTVCR